MIRRAPETTKICNVHFGPYSKDSLKNLVIASVWALAWSCPGTRFPFCFPVVIATSKAFKPYYIPCVLAQHARNPYICSVLKTCKIVHF